MRDKEFFKILLEIGDEPLFAAILALPGLQFLYPVSGLEWVEYCGMGLARIVGKSGKISCDPNKIKAARYIAPEPEEVQMEPDAFEPEPLPRVDVVDPAITVAGTTGEELEKDLERDTNNAEDGGLNMPL